MRLEEEITHLQTTTVLKMYSVFVSNIRISFMPFMIYIKYITQKSHINIRSTKRQACRRRTNIYINGRLSITILLITSQDGMLMTLEVQTKNSRFELWWTIHL